MFDIQEYYNDNNLPGIAETDEIEEDITHDIERLLKNRFQKLYAEDRYKYATKSVDIIYPVLAYPGGKRLLTPDKVRFNLSVYPDKNALRHIDRVVIRPRYIEINGVELAALYLRENRSLVLYMTHPYTYQKNSVRVGQKEEFISVELPNLTGAQQKNEKIDVHPIWHYISVIALQRRFSGMEKFFVKRNPINDADYQTLIDMSYFYSRHGY
ncbi:MAG: hypothetical protein LBT84_08125 [Spirochaetia bacterium]|jgi:hypothetical protein|nr:hypothetical protein [Spirochaetia bacterium]